MPICIWACTTKLRAELIWRRSIFHWQQTNTRLMTTWEMWRGCTFRFSRGHRSWVATETHRAKATDDLWKTRGNPVIFRAGALKIPDFLVFLRLKKTQDRVFLRLCAWSARPQGVADWE